MKILIYAHLFPPTRGGIQYSSIEVAKGLYSLGNQVTLIASNNKGAKGFARQLAFSVKLLPKWSFATMSSLSGWGLLNWFFFPWYIVVFRYNILKFAPDIVLIMDETANAFWGKMRIKKKIPFVSYCSVPLDKVEFTKTIRNTIREIIFFKTRKWLFASYEKAKIIFATSSYTKRKMGESFPDILSKTIVIPRSVDEHFFNHKYDSQLVDSVKQRYSLLKDTVVLLSVSRLTREKGLDDTLKALSRLDKSVLSRVRYFIIGKGAAYSYLKCLAVELKLNQDVHFIQDVPHLDLIQYYDLCDFFILPSHNESFGRVFVEAAARSKPSIGAREGGMVDIIENDVTGYLVDSGDIQTLRDKINFMITNLEKVAMFGKKAREKAVKLYKSEIIASQINNQLRQLVPTVE